jgi:hypothetical protein
VYAMRAWAWAWDPVTQRRRHPVLCSHTWLRFSSVGHPRQDDRGRECAGGQAARSVAVPITLNTGIGRLKVAGFWRSRPAVSDRKKFRAYASSLDISRFSKRRRHQAYSLNFPSLVDNLGWSCRLCSWAIETGTIKHGRAHAGRTRLVPKREGAVLRP